MRHIKFYLLTFAILVLSLSASAQNSETWSAYLLDSVNNDLVQVNENGEMQVFSLGLAPAGETYVHGMSINETGTVAAYCYMYMESPSAEMQDFFFEVRDIQAQSNRFEVSLGNPADCDVSAFSNDLIALSIVYTYPWAEALPADQPTWELRIIDANTGEIRHVLSSLSEFLPEITSEIQMPQGNGAIPIKANVFDLDEVSVKFVAILQNSTHGFPEYPAFEWTFEDNSMTELPIGFGTMNKDYLPETGEVVYRNLNESIDAATPFGPIPLANEVKIVDASGDRVIYTDTEWVIIDTTFVNNGKSVLVYLSEGFEDTPDALEEPGSKYLLINRDGTTIEMKTDFSGVAYVEAIPGGALFAYTANPTMDSPDWKATQLYVLNSNGTLDFHGEYLPNFEDRYSAPYLEWTSPDVVDSNLAPFVGQ